MKNGMDPHLKLFLIVTVIAVVTVTVAGIQVCFFTDNRGALAAERDEQMKLERVAVIGQVGNTYTLQFTFSWDSTIPDAEVLEFVSKFGNGAAIIAISPKKIIFMVPGVFLSRAYREGRG